MRILEQKKNKNQTLHIEAIRKYIHVFFRFQNVLFFVKKNNIFLDWLWLKKKQLYIVIKGLKFFHLVTDQIDSFCFVFFNKVFIAEKNILNFWIFISFHRNNNNLLFWSFHLFLSLNDIDDDENIGFHRKSFLFT